MARVRDLWYTADKRPTARHPDCGGNEKAKRWLATWTEPDGEKTRAFHKQSDADRYAKMMESLGQWCLVPRCERGAVTEPPVLLCADHRDLLVAQATRKRPGVHAPIVYFIRNGSRIKIGWTTNLKGRLSGLSLPATAVLLTISGGPVEENALHLRFRAARVGRTEWFETTPELEAFIEREAAKAETAA